MNIFREHLKLYLVSDRRWNPDGLMKDVETALDHGVTCLQLREKEMDDRTFLSLAKDMQTLAELKEVPFIINDRIEAAVEIGADGVHIGQDDVLAAEARRLIGQDKVLGVSVSTVEEALIAEIAGADYLGVGAMFTTGTKDDAQAVRVETLKEISEAVSIPVVAIGGINLENVMALEGTGVYGVAVVSAILAEKDISKATDDLVAKTELLVNQGIHKVLTIAGSDSSGGAGIQADLKTMAAHGCYGMSVITALTAQNTMGVFDIENVAPGFVSCQMDSVFSDIRPEAVKVGMVSSVEIIDVIAEGLRNHKATHIVIDPVMVATSGSKLLEEGAIKALINKLIPIATIITPNLFEAELLAEMVIETREDMVKAAKAISNWYSGHILIKGGHLDERASDLLYSAGNVKWFSSHRIDNPNTHGTGCTLSSAIASNLAKGYSVIESIERSKDYITGAIENGMNLGKGRGPLNHQYKR